MRTSDLRRRQRALQATGGVVVEFEVLFRRALPVADVRLVPHFPIPARYLLAAVLLDLVPSPSVDQLRPPCVVARRIGPTRPDRTFGKCVLVGLWLRGQSLGH